MFYVYIWWYFSKKAKCLTKRWLYAVLLPELKRFSEPWCDGVRTDSELEAVSWLGVDVCECFLHGEGEQNQLAEVMPAVLTLLNTSGVEKKQWRIMGEAKKDREDVKTENVQQADRLHLHRKEGALWPWRQFYALFIIFMTKLCLKTLDWMKKNNFNNSLKKTKCFKYLLFNFILIKKQL